MPGDVTPGNIWTGDHLEEIHDSVARLCSKFPDEYWRRCDEQHLFPWDFYQAMATAGWVGIAIPEEFGGSGAGITEAAVVLQTVAASGAAMNGATALHLSVFGMNPVVKHGSQAMKERYLPRVARGDLHVAFGVTEPDAGTDTTNISTRARLEGDHYVVRGRKIWTSKALEAEKVLLLVRTTPLAECEKRTDGMTLLLVGLRDPAVDIRPIPKAGRNAVASCEVRYDDLVVPVEDLVGIEGRGFHHLLDGLNPERILIAAEAIGTGRLALDRAVAYACDRVVFGRPIGANQGIAFPLAEAHARLSAAEMMVAEAARRYDTGQPCAEQANLGKWLAADAADLATDRAVQTLGGMGYASEYDVERYWREARIFRLAPVSQEMVMNYVSEHVLGLPRSY
jgi:acyl-CoA dehydrogenase